MASSQAASPAATASAKLSTPPVKPALTEAPSNAQPTPSPQATITSASISPPITDSLIQHTSTSQVPKSTPTSVASPLINQSTATSHPKSISETHAKSPAASSIADTPDSSSDNSSSGSNSSSVAGPVVGSIFAVMVIIVAVVGGVWYLQRRRERSRLRQETKRMRSSNFGFYEPGELIHEKRASIEATLEADLARLRNLEVNIPIIVDDYDAKCSTPSVTHSQSQPVPSLLIARKPSQRVKNSFEVSPSDTLGHQFVPASSAMAPGYAQLDPAEGYDGYQAPTKSPDGLYYHTPASTLAEKR